MAVFETIMSAIHGCPKRPLRVAIDGGSASGKTTLSHQLGEALRCPVVHMDDFFLPPALRTAQRLAEPGGNVHYERFSEEVLPHLCNGTEFTYGIFDCGAMAVTGQQEVAPWDVIIVEGAYSLHPKLADVYDLKVFLRADPQLQAKRILQRNGPEKQAVFLSKWIPLEQQYFESCKVAERADLVLDITE